MLNIARQDGNSLLIRGVFPKHFLLCFPDNFLLLFLLQFSFQGKFLILGRNAAISLFRLAFQLFDPILEYELLRDQFALELLNLLHRVVLPGTELLWSYRRGDCTLLLLILKGVFFDGRPLFFIFSFIHGFENRLICIGSFKLLDLVFVLTLLLFSDTYGFVEVRQRNFLLDFSFQGTSIWLRLGACKEFILVSYLL